VRQLVIKVLNIIDAQNPLPWL